MTTTGSHERLRLLDLDDPCLAHVLVRATARLPSAVPDFFYVDPDYRDDEPAAACLVKCHSLMLVCRRFRDVLLSKATGTCADDSYGLLRFACALRCLEVPPGSENLPWRGESSGDALHINPPTLVHLTNLTRLTLFESSLPEEYGGLEDIVALPLLLELELRGAIFEDGPELQDLTRLTALTSLRLPNLCVVHAPRSSLECLSSLQALRSLGLPSLRVQSDSDLHFITTLTALSALDLRDVHFRGRASRVQPSESHDALLKIASELPALQELRFPYLCITDDGFALIARLTRLTVLHLHPKSRKYPHSESSLRHIAALPSLRKLVVAGSPTNGWWPVPPLGGLSALEALALDVETSSGAGVVVGLPALTRLRLRPKGRKRERAFEPQAAQAIATLGTLRELVLERFCVDAAAWAAICALRALRRLELDCCDVADGGALGACTQLEELKVEHDSARILSPVTLLTALRDLDLSLEASIGREGFASVAALHALTRLRFQSRDSAKGELLTCLTALRQLITLELGQCGNADGVVALACALPKLRELQASVDEVPPKDSASVARLAHLRGCLAGQGRPVELG